MLRHLDARCPEQWFAFEPLPGAVWRVMRGCARARFPPIRRPPISARSLLRLAALRIRPEVLVVDDGSRDATAEVARQFGARVHSFAGEPRQGPRAARRASSAAPTTTAVVTLDADGQHPPECFPDFVRAAEAGRRSRARDARARTPDDAARAPLRQRVLLGMGEPGSRASASPTASAAIASTAARLLAPHADHAGTLRGRDRDRRARGAARVPHRRGRDPDGLRRGEEPDPRRSATCRASSARWCASRSRAGFRRAAMRARGAARAGRDAMILLVTNDDGILAPALRSAARRSSRRSAAW